MGLKARLLNGWRLAGAVWQVRLPPNGSGYTLIMGHPTLREARRTWAEMAKDGKPCGPIRRMTAWTRPRPKPVHITPAEWAEVDAAVEAGR